MDANKIITMSAADVAEGRHRALWVLGGLFLHGPTPASLLALRALPGMERELPDVDPDVLAADHHEVLSRQVVPHESVFLGEKGLLGGATSHAIRELHEASGHRTDAGWMTEPDHMGHELQLLAHLEGAKSDAIADGQGDAQRHIEDLERRLLDEHLLRWMPAFVLSLHAACTGEGPCGPSVGRYVTAAELALHLAADLRQELGGLPVVWELPEPRCSLDDERTSLKDISRHLSTPALAGGLIPLAGIQAVSASVGLPPGFGSRMNTLENVLHAAASQDKVDALAEALHLAFVQWQGRLQEMAELGLATHTEPWVSRLHDSMAMLRQMRSAASASESESSTLAMS